MHFTTQKWLLAAKKIYEKKNKNKKKIIITSTRSYTHTQACGIHVHRYTKYTQKQTSSYTHIYKLLAFCFASEDKYTADNTGLWQHTLTMFLNIYIWHYRKKILRNILRIQHNIFLIKKKRKTKKERKQKNTLQPTKISNPYHLCTHPRKACKNTLPHSDMFSSLN